MADITAQETENCFIQEILTHTVEEDLKRIDNSSLSGPYVTDFYYHAIISNILGNLISTSFLLAAFVLLFTWVGSRIPVWNYLVQKLHEITCQLEEKDSDIGFKFRNLPTAKKFLKIALLDTEFMVSTCGRDAMEFLIFQRYLCGFAVIIMMLVLTVTMPVHQLVGKNDDASTFQSTSLRNLQDNSIGLWLDIITGALYLPIAIFIMRKFAASLHFLSKRDMSRVRRTLVFYQLPKRLQDIDSLKKWLEDNYQSFTVEAINLCVSWKEADNLKYLKDYYRMVLKECRLHCGCLQRKKIWKLKYLGILLFWWKAHINGHRYYEKELAKVNQKLEERLNEINEGKHILDTAFVTMRTTNEAVGIYLFQNFRLRAHKLFKVSYARLASSIRWRNITAIRYFTYKNIGHWLLLGLMVLIFSFPQILATHIKNEIESYTNTFFESVWFYFTSSVVPIITLRTTEYLGYWGQTRINRELLTKAYICLLAILFVIPILNPDAIVLSLETYLRVGKFNFDWRCVFLPDNGVFFFNNLITFALLGNCLRLCRFVHLLWHTLAFLTSRSLCEAKTVSRFLEREFYWIGERAAWTLVHFTVMIGLSISCPLIMVAGVFYLFITHAVDTYLIYKRFFIIPALDARSFYHKCITIVLFSTWVLQISTSAFLVSRRNIATNYDAFTVSLLIAMPCALIIAYQNSMRHEGPFEIYQPIKYSSNWSRKSDAEVAEYHPPKILKDVPFPSSKIHYHHEESGKQA